MKKEELKSELSEILSKIDGGGRIEDKRELVNEAIDVMGRMRKGNKNEEG